MVRDEGSWLDIGTSISQFAIASLLGIFVSGLEVVGEVFVRGVEVEGGDADADGQRRRGLMGMLGKGTRQVSYVRGMEMQRC